MRTMMKITVPVAPGNKAIRDGSLPRVIQMTLEKLKPEAAYFGLENGKRTGVVFFELADPSQVPVICEPLFMELDAEIELVPVMSAQDLQTGLSQLPRA
jgi:hypothetical protein